ncbi:hypothetical protein K4749_22970 [Streptomyces sp. TRM72054]|uniref:hypothetical protein n=1 Tax=Streptomyces sp. TRM72054 TaxID=2870562 RepID=UPI001C8B1FE2|nr:hypothetical protein [Streptomyces sp. TRM72054]MBX9396377.1 hypothetical protein [Streptomyces sp. TRM72054]
MAWRDRWRRRRAASAAPDGDVAGVSGPAGAAGPSVPGDWDGGWRRTAAPELTVSRAPLGVSDGLVFRAGLAAWQNPSFDSDLGHAVLPTAPAGLVRGVTRPAAPQAVRTGTGGGPLLLRSVRAVRAEGAEGDTSDAGNLGNAGRPSVGGATPVVRGARAGVRSSGAVAGVSGSSGSGSSGSGAFGSGSSGSVAAGSSGSGSGSSGATAAGSGSSGSLGSGSGSSRTTSSSARTTSGSAGAGAGAGAGLVVARSGDNSAAGEGRSADAPRTHTRGITSADSPAVLSSSLPAVQRAAEPGTAPVVTPADIGRPAAAREIPLVRRVAVVPGTAVDGSLNRPAPAARPSAPGPDSGSASRSSGGSGGRTSSGPAVQRAATGTTGARSEVSIAAGADVSHLAVQLRPVGPRLTVARRQAGPVRRVPALRPVATPPPGHGAIPDAPGAATTAPAGTGAPSTAPVQRAATRAGSRAPLGAPLTELPSTATPLAEGTPAPRPASGPVLPVVQRQTEGAGMSDGGGQGTVQEGPAPRRTSDLGRSGARARGGLGAPLPALPPSADVPGSAASGARASRPAPGPDIQRAPARQDDRGPAPAPDRDGTPTDSALPAREESGANAPLLGSVDVQRRLADGSSAQGISAPGPTAHGDVPAAPLLGSVDVQRRLADDSSAQGISAPGPTEQGDVPAAPLLGSVDVQRRLADGSSTQGISTPGHTDHGNVSAAPLVTPSSPAAAPEGAVGVAVPVDNAPHLGTQRPQVPGAPGPVVVARALAEGAPDARTSATDQPAPAAAHPHGTEGAARTADPRPLTVTGSAAHSTPAAPHPHGTEGAARTADPRPLTVTGSAAHSTPAAPLTLQLLPARPLTLNTRAPEGVAQPPAARSGTRPVVAMRWPGDPAAPQGQGDTGTPARPAPGTSAAAPATPHMQRAATPNPGPATRNPGPATPNPGPAAPATPPVQRAATAHPGPENSGERTASSTVAVQRVPVVRPAPPHRETHGAPAPAAAAPARSLPVTAPRTPPLTDRPSAPSASAPTANVPVVRPRTAAPGGAATPVQRAPYSADDSVLPGNMDKALPTRGRQRSVSAAGDLAVPHAEPAKSAPAPSRSRSASAKRAAHRTAHRAETPGALQDPAIDLDDLARRLLDPMARLLRTELRRGRERTGRPYDGRR